MVFNSAMLELSKIKFDPGSDISIVRQMIERLTRRTKCPLLEAVSREEQKMSCAVAYRRERWSRLGLE